MARPRGPATHYRHMNKEIADLIRDLYFSRQKKQQELAEMFNVKQNTISRIVSGMVWA